MLKRRTTSVELLESRRLLAADFALGLGLGGGGTDGANDIAVDSSGNIYVAGTFRGTADFDPSSATKNLTSAGGVDLFVAKYSSSGALAWAHRVGGAGDETPGGIAVDPGGNVYVTGGFTGTADFDPSSATHNLTSSGSTDIFAWKLTKDGNWSWAHRAGGGAADSGSDLAIDAGGNVLVTGSFNGNVDFDFGASTVSHQSAFGGDDAFLWTLTSGGNYTSVASFGGSGTDIGNAVAVTAATSGPAAGRAFVAGSFTGTVQVGTDGPVFTSAGGTDAFVWETGTGLTAGEGSFRRGGAGDDAATAIAVDPDGSVYLAGTFSGTVDFNPSVPSVTLTSAGGADAFVMKVGPALVSAGGSALQPRVLQFARRAGAMANESVTGLAVDAAGSLYVSGAFQGTVDFDPSALDVSNRTSAGGRDAFVWKLTPGGALSLVRQFGSAGDDVASAVAVNSNGDLFTAGAFSGTVDLDPGSGTMNITSKGASDAFISKLSATTFAFGEAIKIGAGGIPTITSTATDAAGNAYVLGDFDGTVDFDPGTGATELTDSGNDRFIAKYTPEGALVWAKAFSVEEVDVGTFNARDIAVDPAGNVSVTGDYVTRVQGFYDPEGYVAHFDVNGDLAWIRHSGGDTDAKGVAVATDAAGNVYDYRWVNFAGIQRTLEKRNPQGDLLWKLQPTFRVQDIAVDSAGNVLLGGDNGKEVGDPPANIDAMVAKVSPAGVLTFTKQFGGTGTDGVASIAADGAGNILLSGSYEGTADFDPGSGKTTLGQPGSTFVSKLTPAGTFAWVKAGGANAGAIPRVSADAFGNVYTAGTFTGTVDFDPGSGTTKLSSAGGTDLFLRKLNAAGNFVTAVRIGGAGADSAAGAVVGGGGSFLYAFGTFTGTVDFDPGAGTFNLSTTTRDFLLRLGL